MVEQGETKSVPQSISSEPEPGCGFTKIIGLGNTGATDNNDN